MLVSHGISNNGNMTNSESLVSEMSAQVYVRGGSGGEGAASFKVMAKKQRGKPNGGSGGKGGDVTLVRGLAAPGGLTILARPTHRIALWPGVTPETQDAEKRNLISLQ